MLMANGLQGLRVAHTRCGGEIVGVGLRSGRGGDGDGWQCDSSFKKLG